jgi:hypothetical protein
MNENSVREDAVVCIRDGSQTDNCLCSICDRTFSNEKGLAIHHAKKHPERQSEDTVNNEVPLIHQDKELNSDNGTKSRLYECSLCDRSFSSKRGQMLHCRRMHDGIGMFSSSVVSDNNRPVNPVNVTVPSRTEGGPFECSFCGSVFNNEKGLKIHSTKNHRNQLLHSRSVEVLNADINLEEPSGTSCNICNRTFGSEEALTLHFSKNHAHSHASTVIIPPFSTGQNIDTVSENLTKKMRVHYSDCKKTVDTQKHFKIHVGKQHLDLGYHEY